MSRSTDVNLVLPQTRAKLRRVNRIIFRVADSAFQLLIVEGNTSARVSTSTVDLTDWAPGFTGDCAFNFVLSIMHSVTGYHFVRDTTVSQRYVAFDRQERIHPSRRKT